MSEERQCRTCIFFELKQTGLIGHCHRYAPSPVRASQTSWPLVSLDDWCGEWKFDRANKTSHGTPLATLELSVRAWNAIERDGIFTVEQLTQRTPEDILGLKNIGMTTLREIISNLEKAGLTLKSEVPENGDSLS